MKHNQLNRSFVGQNVRWALAALSALCLAISLGGCSKGCKKEEPATTVPSGTSQPGGTASDVTELKVEDLVTGTGESADIGKQVTVHYTGWLTNGTKFDSSVDKNQPFEFVLGEHSVIEGWEQGLLSPTKMKVGGKRKLMIPPQLAYKEYGAGGVIPPNATLIFEVELLKVE